MGAQSRLIISRVYRLAAKDALSLKVGRATLTFAIAGKSDASRS